MRETAVRFSAGPRKLSGYYERAAYEYHYQSLINGADLLPSVRSLSKELKISALTVKKAYDRLEEEGFVVTVHGKGSFIAAANQELMMEERRRDVEASLETAIQKGRQYGLSDGEIRSLFELVLED